jgi:hypothetical protein
MRNALLLLTGLILTIVFLIFCTPIYEWLYFEQAFSQTMYDNNMYLIIAIITVIIVWGFAALFYYFINSVRFARWYNWLLILVIAALISSIVTYYYLDYNFIEAGYDESISVQLTNFTIINLAVTIVLFIIVSFSIRWWSGNCRHTPVPE